MDYMNDFATEDFFLKNVRVRPQSGISRDADADKQGQSRFGGMDGIAEIGDDQTIQVDIKTEREKIK